MSEKFKEGAVVQLNSGGPAMTYTGEDDLGEAMCFWFVGTERKAGKFPQFALKAYVAPSLTGTASRG